MHRAASQIAPQFQVFLALNLIIKIDKKYSIKLNIADKFRISKLLEIYFETKKNITYFHSINKKTNNYNFFKVLISPEKNKVKLNIKNRVMKMLEEGLVEELNYHNHSSMEDSDRRVRMVRLSKKGEKLYQKALNCCS